MLLIHDLVASCLCLGIRLWMWNIICNFTSFCKLVDSISQASHDWASPLFPRTSPQPSLTRPQCKAQSRSIKHFHAVVTPVACLVSSHRMASPSRDGCRPLHMLHTEYASNQRKFSICKVGRTNVFTVTETPSGQRASQMCVVTLIPPGSDTRVQFLFQGCLQA